MQENGACAYQFGKFRIDSGQRVLAREGDPIPLPPKAFDLLALFVGDAGRLLTKQRIMDALWPETFVEEANLANLIALLRKVLGDTTRQPAYIETVPKHGYRFVAHVSPITVESGVSPTNETNADGAIRFIAFPFRSTGSEGADFLAHSIPEAIAATLAELNAFTVRSTQMAARFDPEHWDPRTVAAEADVDVILRGTIHLAEGQIHASTELIDAGTAKILWSEIWDVSSAELHRVHSGIVQLIVRSLIRSTRTSGSLMTGIDTPATADGYTLYLRANELTLRRSIENMVLARDLYIACTDIDPGYAPAWARLGRCCHWLEKFGGTEAAAAGSAETAFARAFGLNPHLSIAHSAYTPLQCDAGHAVDAMTRLIPLLQHKGSNPEIFAALVHCCRYCGETDASIAAHDRAFRLDRRFPTSVAHTYFGLGDYERALYWYDTNTGVYLDVLSLTMMGRLEEASALMWTRRQRFSMQPALMYSLRCCLDGDAAGALSALREHGWARAHDPEVRFYLARQAARFGDASLALRFLTESVSAGYGSSLTLMQDPWLGILRGSAEFEQVLLTVRAREREAHESFVRVGGDLVLAEAARPC